MKKFTRIKMEHVEGLSWWFWTREAFAAINTGVGECFGEDPVATNFKEWLILLALIPMAYLITFNYAAYIRRNYVRKCVDKGNSFLIYNKNNIAYFTVLEMLTGEHSETI